MTSEESKLPESDSQAKENQEPWQLLAEHPFVAAGLFAQFKPHLILAGACLATASCLLALDVVESEAIVFWLLLILGSGLLFLAPILFAYRRRIQLVRVHEQGLAWMSQ